MVCVWGKQGCFGAFLSVSESLCLAFLGFFSLVVLGRFLRFLDQLCIVFFLYFYTGPFWGSWLHFRVFAPSHFGAFLCFLTDSGPFYRAILGCLFLAVLGHFCPFWDVCFWPFCDGFIHLFFGVALSNYFGAVPCILGCFYLLSLGFFHLVVLGCPRPTVLGHFLPFWGTSPQSF